MWICYTLSPAADLSEASLEAAIKLLEDKTNYKAPGCMLEVSVLDLLSAVDLQSHWNRARTRPQISLTVSRTGNQGAWAVYVFDDYVFCPGA